MNSTECIPQAELERLLIGDLDAVRLQTIAEHVDGCEPCQDTVVALSEQSNTFVDNLKVAVRAPAAQENALRLGVRRMLTSLPSQSSDAEVAAPVGWPSQIGPYQIQEQLGLGGMGHVYRATHNKLKRNVAVKVLPANRWSKAGAIARFEREMEAIGALDHPYIVSASDAGEDHGMHYLVMEFVDGLDLSRLVNRIGPLPVAEACELARQCAIGLEHAHQSGLVHRDIKPSNLMLAKSKTGADGPTLKILDLGLALLGDEHLQEAHEITTVGTLMGTLDYMSPEQGVDSHSVDQRTDIYSLGATLFKLLSGRAPYADPQHCTLMKKMTALATKPAPSISTVRDDLPQGLSEVIDRMLARDPAERFESAQDAADALSQFSQTADLHTLLARGSAASDPEIPYTASFPNAGDAATSARTSSGGEIPRNGSRAWLVLIVTGLLALAAGILFHVATDYGELTITSNDPTATVLVQRAEKTIQSIKIENGEESLRLRTGDYDLVVTGDANVSITPSSVAIVRGSQEKAAVQIQPKVREEVVATDPRPSQITHNGPPVISAAEREGNRIRIEELNGEAKQLAELGKTNAALEICDEAIAIEPNFDSLLHKARLLRQLGWKEPAINAYSEAAQLTSEGDDDLRQLVVVELGDAYLENEQFNHAVSAFSAGLDKHGATLDPDVWFKIGVAVARRALHAKYTTEQTRTEELLQARQYLNRAMQLDPAHVGALKEQAAIEDYFASTQQLENELRRDEAMLAELTRELEVLQQAVDTHNEMIRSLDTKIEKGNAEDGALLQSELSKVEVKVNDLLKRKTAAGEQFFKLLEKVWPRRKPSSKYISTESRLEILVNGALPDATINGIYKVEGDRKVNLGDPYGRVGLCGLTAKEAGFMVSQHLSPFLNAPRAGVSIVEDTRNPSSKSNAADVQSSKSFGDFFGEDSIQPNGFVRIHVPNSIPDEPIDGVYPVEGSGSVHLGARYGRVKIAGLNYEQAEEAIERHLEEILRDPNAMVTRPVPKDVAASGDNPAFYVPTQFPGNKAEQESSRGEFVRVLTAELKRLRDQLAVAKDSSESTDGFEESIEHVTKLLGHDLNDLPANEEPADTN